MSETQRQSKSFVKEAAILSVANFVVKIIGVLYKIPLANILGDSMGVFTAAYSIYAMLFMISTSGLPVAISRLVAASAERGRGREVNRIFKISLIIFGLIGIVATLFLIFFADIVLGWANHPESAFAARIIAPTLFFICVCSAIRGYFQGLRNMLPTAISQFIEALFKMTLGLGAVLWARSQGFSATAQAAYAFIGLTFGAFASMIFLIICKSVSKRKPPAESNLSAPSNILAKRIITIAFPVTVTASALYLSQFLDTMLINNRLIAGGIAPDIAEKLYSAYTTLAISISDLLPSTLVFPIAISILPAVSAALAVSDKRAANGYIHSSIRISGIIALPCAAFLCATARPCIALVYGVGWGSEIVIGSTTLAAIDIAAPALSIVSLGIFGISLVSTTNALLQAYGKIWLPMVSVGSGVLALAIFEYFSVSGVLGIYGAPVASILCYLVAMIMNMMFLRKETQMKLKPLSLFLKPAVCAIVSGIVTYGVYMLCHFTFAYGESRIQSFLTMLICGVTMVICYAFLILICKGITKREIKLLPFGNRICAYFENRGARNDG